MSWKLFVISMKYPVLFWLAIAVFCGGLAFARFASVNAPDPNQPDPNNLPIYPGAYSLTTRDNAWLVYPSGGTAQGAQAGTQVMGKYIDYQTNAKPEEVLAFYRRVMPARGWPTPEGDNAATATPEPGWPTPAPQNETSLLYIYTHYRRGFLTGGTITQFLVSVTVKAIGNGATSVELKTGL